MCLVRTASWVGDKAGIRVCPPSSYLLSPLWPLGDQTSPLVPLAGKGLLDHRLRLGRNEGEVGMNSTVASCRQVTQDCFVKIW